MSQKLCNECHPVSAMLGHLLCVGRTNSGKTELFLKLLKKT